MDPIKLHNKAEQRCKPLGCKVQGCMKEAQQPEKCNQLLREFQQCVSQEKQKILEEFSEKKNKIMK